jgi:hypothetical protein
MSVRPIITLPDEKILRQVSAPLKGVDAKACGVFDDQCNIAREFPCQQEQSRCNSTKKPRSF